MSKWGEDVTCEFVTNYSRHECLWNPKFESYRNRATRQMAYQAIAIAMNRPDCGVTEVKTKIKNLRSTYFQEARKVQSSCEKNNGNPTYQPRLKWYGIMNQIIEMCESPEKQQNNPLEEIEAHYAYVEESVEDPGYDVEDVKTNILLETISEHESTNHFGESSAEPPPEIHPRKTPKIEAKTPSVPKKRRAQKSNCSPKIISTVDDDVKDEFYHFGNHVAAQLRQLPLENALRIQLELQRMLMKERLSIIMSRKNDDDYVSTRRSSCSTVDYFTDTNFENNSPQ